MNLKSIDFSGNKILVADATTNVGKAIAIYLSKLNANLVIVGANEEKLIETFKLLQGDNHKYYCLDLYKENDSIEKIFKNSLEDGIKFSGLVFCLEENPILPIEQLTREKVHEIMGINLYSFIELMRQFEKRKYTDGGSVVAISSIASEQPEKYQTIYSSSKLALNAAVRTLSIELINKNIRVNAVLPGVTSDAENYESDLKLKNLISEKQKLGLINNESLASLVAFLLSEQANYVTGREFYYDGGRF